MRFSDRLLGRRIGKIENNTGNETIQFNFNLLSGVYFAKPTFKENVKAQKIIKIGSNTIVEGKTFTGTPTINAKYKITKTITKNNIPIKTINQPTIPTTTDADSIIVTVRDPLGVYNTNIQRAAFGDTLEHVLINVDTTQGGFDMNSFLMLQFENQAYNTRMINTNDIPNAEPPMIMASFQSSIPDYDLTQQEIDSLIVADTRDSLWTKIFNMGYKGTFWNPDSFSVGNIFDPSSPDSNAIYIYALRDSPNLGGNIAVLNINGVVIRGGIYLNTAYHNIISTYHEEAADVVCGGEQENFGISAESVNGAAPYVTPWDIIRFERVNNHTIGATVYNDPTLGWTIDETAPTAPLGNSIEEALENLTRNNKNRDYEILDENYIISFSKGMSEHEKIINRYLLNSKENKIKMFPEIIRKYQ